MIRAAIAHLGTTIKKTKKNLRDGDNLKQVIISLVEFKKMKGPIQYYTMSATFRVLLVQPQTLHMIFSMIHYY